MPLLTVSSLKERQNVQLPAASLGNLVIFYNSFYNRPYFPHFLDGTKAPEKACVGVCFVWYLYSRDHNILSFLYDPTVKANCTVLVKQKVSDVTMHCGQSVSCYAILRHKDKEIPTLGLYRSSICTFLIFPSSLFRRMVFYLDIDRLGDKYNHCITQPRYSHWYGTDK